MDIFKYMIASNNSDSIYDTYVEDLGSNKYVNIGDIVNDITFKLGNVANDIDVKFGRLFNIKNEVVKTYTNRTINKKMKNVLDRNISIINVINHIEAYDNDIQVEVNNISMTDRVNILNGYECLFKHINDVYKSILMAVNNIKDVTKMLSKQSINKEHPTKVLSDIYNTLTSHNRILELDLSNNINKIINVTTAKDVMTMFFEFKINNKLEIAIKGKHKSKFITITAINEGLNEFKEMILTNIKTILTYYRYSNPNVDKTDIIKSINKVKSIKYDKVMGLGGLTNSIKTYKKYGMKHLNIKLTEYLYTCSKNDNIMIDTMKDMYSKILLALKNIDGLMSYYDILISKIHDQKYLSYLYNSIGKECNLIHLSLKDNKFIPTYSLINKKSLANIINEL